MDELATAGRISGAALGAQSLRMRVIAENIANASSTGSQPGADPYRRKTVSFAAEVEERSGAELVAVESIDTDQRPFALEHDPGHPAADEKGVVKRPNVNPLIELADMREANRAYLANLQMIKAAREAISMTIDLLRTP